MNLAKMSVKGQVVIPVEVKRKLNLKAGDKILFLERGDGEIVISNASFTVISNNRTDINKPVNDFGIN
jgi:antitoxin PrlF